MLKSKAFLVGLICNLLILLFVYAAINKWLDFQKFQIQVGQSPMLTIFAPVIVWLVPILEILISILLSIPVTRLTGLYASFSLMIIFSSYIVAITRFSAYTPCSCGGVIQNLSWSQHLLFNMGFVLISLAGIVLQSGDSRSVSYLKKTINIP